MIYNGWIKLHRKLLDNPKIMKDNDYMVVWVKLLLLVEYQPKKEWFGGQNIELQPGQIITTRDKLAAFCNVNASKLERVLSWFESEQQIEQRKTNVNRCISILNWAKFQASEQPFEQQMNNECTTSEQPVNNAYISIKEEKNIRNKEVLNTPPIIPPNELENFEVPENVEQVLNEATEGVTIQLNTGKEKRKKIAPKKENEILLKFVEIYKAQFPDISWQPIYKGKIDKISSEVMKLYKIYHMAETPTEEQWLRDFELVIKNLNPWYVNNGLITPTKILEHWEAHVAHLKKLKDGKGNTNNQARPSHTEQHNALKQYARTLSDVG